MAHRHRCAPRKDADAGAEPAGVAGRLVAGGRRPVAELTAAAYDSAEPARTEPGAAPALPRRTGRLVLRPFRHGDEGDVLAYRSRDDVVRFMPADPLQPAAAGRYPDRG